jgi:HK97 family phage portal protein
VNPGTERRDSFMDQMMAVVLGGGNSSSGVSVTPDSALTSSAVFACVRVLAETLASLPLITYERKGKSRERAVNFYLYPILHDEPNPYMTSFELRETLQGHLALWGNAYSQLDYDSRNGQITSIFPLRPDRMMDIRIENGVKMYKYQLPHGEQVWINGERVWHLKAFGDGIWGYSPVELMRNAIGLTLGLEKYGSKLFGNGARPGGVLEHPGKLGPEAAKNLRASWNEAHMGLENSHKVAILEEGLKWHEIGMPNDDAQFLESRKFQVSEVARIWRVPPHMVGDLEKATFNNIEELGIEFVQYTLAPWLVMWEQSIRQNLLTEGEKNRYYAEFLVDGLLRGDTLSRYQAYQSGILSGWFTRADAREKENLNPIDGLEKPLVPMNMMEVESESAAPSSVQGQEEQRNHPQITQIPQIEEQRGEEVRGKEAAQSRHRLQGVFRGLYLETAGRILGREAKDVKNAVRRTGKDWVSLRLWMEEYYREHADYVKRQMMPVGRAYGQQVADLAAREIEKDAPDESVEQFTESYTGGYAARHVGISKSKIEQAHAKAMQDEVDVEEALIGELDTWPDARAASIATEESTRFNNAMAKMVYGALGVQFLRSVAFGENCPYCNALDGAIVGINEFFIKAGGELKPEGVDEPLRSSTDLGHAPYHDGCDCMVVAG